MNQESELKIYDIKPIPEVAFMPSSFLWFLLLIFLLIGLTFLIVLMIKNRKEKSGKLTIKESKKILEKLLNTENVTIQAEHLYLLLNNLEKLKPKILIENADLQSALFKLREQRFQKQVNLDQINLKELISILNNSYDEL